MNNNYIKYDVTILETCPMDQATIKGGKAAGFLHRSFNRWYPEASSPTALQLVSHGLDLFRSAYNTAQDIAAEVEDVITKDQHNTHEGRLFNQNFDGMCNPAGDFLANSVVTWSMIDSNTTPPMWCNMSAAQMEDFIYSGHEGDPATVTMRRTLFGPVVNNEINFGLFSMTQWLESYHDTEGELEMYAHNSGEHAAPFFDALALSCDAGFSLIAGACQMAKQWDNIAEAVRFTFNTGNAQHAGQVFSTYSDYFRNVCITYQEYTTEPVTDSHRLPALLEDDDPKALAYVKKLIEDQSDNPRKTNAGTVDLVNGIDTALDDIINGSELPF